MLLSLCVLLMQALAGIDVFLRTLPGAGGDAQVFLQQAMGLLQHPGRLPALSIGAHAYLQYLWGFGRLFTSDAMVLHYAAIVPACLSLALIATIVCRLDGRPPALCATALLLLLSPGLLLYSSITVRESLELG